MSELPYGFTTEEIQSHREKLISLYVAKMEGWAEEEWERIKKFTTYYGRDVSINRLTPEFPLKNKENQDLTFLEVRRFLNWLLTGKDYEKKWDRCAPLFITLTEKAKELCMKHQYDFHTITFAFENEMQKGNYALKFVKNLKNTSSPKTKLEFKQQKQPFAKPSFFERKKVEAPVLPSQEILEGLDSAKCLLEILSKAKGKEVFSNGEINTLAIRLCHIASEMLDGKKQ